MWLLARVVLAFAISYALFPLLQKIFPVDPGRNDIEQPLLAVFALSCGAGIFLWEKKKELKVFLPPAFVLFNYYPVQYYLLIWGCTVDVCL